MQRWIALPLCLLASTWILSSTFPSSRELATEGRADEEMFSIDVACDGRTYRQSDGATSVAASQRGDTFVVEGTIYPGGTIPAGENVFSPDRPGSIGRWICRGVWLISTEQLLAGASPAFFTTQTYLLPDENAQLLSEGLEGPPSTLRVVTGGTGSRRGMVGEVQQEVLGTNVTGLFNFRFTFRLRRNGS